MTFSNKFIILVVFIFCVFISHAQVASPDAQIWKEVKNTGSIQVYTRTPENSNLKEIRVIANFKADINVFLGKLNDPSTYTTWVYKCTEGKVLQKLDEQSFYYYTTCDLPFPAKDRDMVVLCHQWKDKNGVFHSRSTAKPNFIEDKSDFVRVPYFESNWDITPKEDGTIHIDYVALSDPGGSIPAWIVNLAIASGPLKTMEQLETLVSITHNSTVIGAK